VPPDDWSQDFPAFAPAFESEPEESGAYLALLGAGSSEAVLMVAQCLDAAEDKRKQVSNLLRGAIGFEIDQLRAHIRVLGEQLSDAVWDQLMESSNWRPQVVGCVALLAMNAQERPLDALLDAACRPSWVSPQLLATTSLVDVPDWFSEVEGAILDRDDDAKLDTAKAAAALCALEGRGSSELIDLANVDTQSGGRIAVGWRNRIRTTFDEAHIAHSW
jgi:hypothetical protein